MNVEYETDTQSDEDLVKLAQQGTTEAFGILVERYEAKLLRYGRKFLSNTDDIQDIVQTIFLNAYQNIKSFDTSQRFSPWIYRIAHNTFVNSLRSKSRSLLSFVDFDTEDDDKTSLTIEVPLKNKILSKLTIGQTIYVVGDFTNGTIKTLGIRTLPKGH